MKNLCVFAADYNNLQLSQSGFYGVSMLTFKDIIRENDDAEPHFSTLNLLDWVHEAAQNVLN